MNDIAIFLNNRVLDRSPFLVDRSVAFGDWCLKPVRYVFGGNLVTISWGDGLGVYHKPIRWNKSLGGTILAIILLLPGVIIGSPFKLLGYLTAKIRAEHLMIRKHYTPIDFVAIGDSTCSLQDLEGQIEDYKIDEKYHRPIKNLVLFARSGTEIDVELGLRDIHLEKIILVGARIISSNTNSCTLDDYLVNNGWECRSLQGNGDSLVKQQEISFIHEAVESAGASKRVFVVERHGQKIVG